MKTISIKLYSFGELGKEAQGKAINQHREFLASIEETNDYWETIAADSEVIENITINDYLFYNDGEIASCTTYTGSHDRAGQTEFHFHGQNFLLSSNQ